MSILEQIGGYSISAIEVRQFILLFQVDTKIVSTVDTEIVSTVDREIVSTVDTEIVSVAIDDK